jgi:hypothetical protein
MKCGIKICSYLVSGHSSVVERNLAKVDVARSNRVARFNLYFK